MRKIDKDLGEASPPCVLWLEDLEDILRIIKSHNRKIEGVSTENYEYDSWEEMFEREKGGTLNGLKINTKKSELEGFTLGITLVVQRTSIVLFYPSLDNEEKNFVREIREIFLSHTRECESDSGVNEIRESLIHLRYRNKERSLPKGIPVPPNSFEEKSFSDEMPISSESHVSPKIPVSSNSFEEKTLHEPDSRNKKIGSDCSKAFLNPFLEQLGKLSAWLVIGLVLVGFLFLILIVWPGSFELLEKISGLIH